MKGPPAKINMADPEPSRGLRYRYPEEAKRLIAETLQDMGGQTNHRKINICMAFTHSFGQ